MILIEQEKLLEKRYGTTFFDNGDGNGYTNTVNNVKETYRKALYRIIANLINSNCPSDSKYIDYEKILSSSNYNYIGLTIKENKGKNNENICIFKCGNYGITITENEINTTQTKTTPITIILETNENNDFENYNVDGKEFIKRIKQLKNNPTKIYFFIFEYIYNALGLRYINESDTADSITLDSEDISKSVKNNSKLFKSSYYTNQIERTVDLYTYVNEIFKVFRDLNTMYNFDNRYKKSEPDKKDLECLPNYVKKELKSAVLSEMYAIFLAQTKTSNNIGIFTDKINTTSVIFIVREKKENNIDILHCVLLNIPDDLFDDIITTLKNKNFTKKHDLEAKEDSLLKTTIDFIKNQWKKITGGSQKTKREPTKKEPTKRKPARRQTPVTVTASYDRSYNCPKCHSKFCVYPLDTGLATLTESDILRCGICGEEYNVSDVL